MAGNTILEFYRFTLENKVKEQQVLNFYNEEEDLLDTLNDFCKYIFDNVKKYTDNQGKYRTFTLASLPKIERENRILYGFLDSAYTGEYGKIKDARTNGVKYDLTKKDLFSKDFFFLIYVPKGSKYGYLVIQRKENHGVKTIIQTSFNWFMRSKGVTNYFLELRQAPLRYFMNNFFNSGILKEYKLIKNTDNGREEKIFKLNNKCIQKSDLKKNLVSLFNSKNQEARVQFLGNELYDEISFIINLNGSTKTFYIKNKDKIRSNINVSHLIEFEDGEPTIQSLVRISLEIIQIAA